MKRTLPGISLLLSLAVIPASLHAQAPEKTSATLAATLSPPGGPWAVAATASTVVVGAPYGPAAYVYERNQGGTNRWGQTRKLAPVTPNDDRFGWSVAIAGDTIAVGENFGGNIGEGVVYIFERNKGGAGKWGQVKRIPAPDPSLLGGFGESVALSGDTLVVGTSILDAAYVLSRNKGGKNQWGVVKKLEGPSNSFFGISVGVSGDLAVVGTDAKAAYLFNRNQGGANQWGLVKTFTAPDSGGSEFGSVVAVSGLTVALGAPRCTPIYGPGIDTGAAGCVFVYGRNQGGPAAWGLIKKLFSPDAYRFRYFGSSVAISGDVIVAGSPAEFQKGSACLFSRNLGGPNTWGAVALWQSDNDSFGVSSAVAGDTAVVGQSGTAFVFRVNP